MSDWKKSNSAAHQNKQATSNRIFLLLFIIIFFFAMEIRVEKTPVIVVFTVFGLWHYYKYYETVWRILQGQNLYIETVNELFSKTNRNI